jgi:hypothetical protein
LGLSVYGVTSLLIFLITGGLFVRRLPMLTLTSKVLLGLASVMF